MKYNKKYYGENRDKYKKNNEKYRSKNKDKIKAYHNKYKKDNPEKIKEIRKRYYKKHKEQIRMGWRKWAKNNPKRIKEKNKRYRIKNNEKIKEHKKRFYQEHKEKVKRWCEEWVKNNKEKMRDYRKNYNKKYEKEHRKEINKNRKIRKSKDKNFKIKCLLRTRFIETLKKYTKTGKIYPSKKYGIDYKVIIKHLKPFPKDLSNYEIHHIKPLFTFNFVNPDGSTNLKEVKKAWKPKNIKLVTIKEHKDIHRILNNNITNGYNKEFKVLDWSEAE